MVEPLDDVPPGVLGFRVKGDIEREDYEIEPAALRADLKLGWNVVIQNRDAWVRSAIVTDIEWMARAARMFLWMIPGEARVFPVAGLEQAKAWVAAS